MAHPDPKLIDAVMGAIKMLSERVAARGPNYRPMTNNPIVLASAQCWHNCERCYIECAIAPDRLKWWEGELARVCGSHRMGRC